MPRRLRLAIFALAIASAFAGGYLFKSPPSRSTFAAEPAAKVEAPTRVAAKPVSGDPVPDGQPPVQELPRAVAIDSVKAPESDQRVLIIQAPPAPKAEPPTILLPPVAVSEAPKLEPVDPSDRAFQMIKNQLGIKTTILDKSAPPPLVLADAKRIGDVDVPPVPAPPPEPMAGPAPKLEIPRIGIGIEPGPGPDASPAPKPVPLLNDRAVELDFEVTRAGLSKVTAVELWTTRDGGATWKRTDRMDGARPPFRTRLGSEGEYGFRLVFESEVGMRTPDPKPGQQPDVVMELDTTPPTIEIYSPTAGPLGTVVLRWVASDKFLDRDPAATRLEYSADGQTWQPIARPASPPDPTSHEWVLPPGVPSKVLFRVIARDKAGNVATAVTNEKMSVDLVAPEGKVTGVRTQGAEPEKGPMPHEFRAGPPVGGPVPALLRSVLPALLSSSPLVFPTATRPAVMARAPEAWDVSGNDLTPPPEPVGVYVSDGSGCYFSGMMLTPRPEPPFVSPKDWVAGLAKTDVVEARPVWTYQRREPFAVLNLGEPLLTDDVERAVVILGSRVYLYDPAATDWEYGPLPPGTQAPGFGAVKPADRTLPVREHASLARTVWDGILGPAYVNWLTDSDWQPSTAKPETYRWTTGPTFADRPFGGVYDVAGPREPYQGR